MRTGRPKRPLTLTEDEQERLQSLAPSRAQPAGAGSAGPGGAGLRPGTGEQERGEETALLAGHGGQVAFPISQESPGRAL